MSKLLPSNTTRLEHLLADAMAQLSDTPIIVRELHNPDTIPFNALPWLAWALSVDDWHSNWSEAQKRATVKAALDVQKIKGTIGAVKRGLAALGLDVQVQEWFNQTPQAAPGTFKLIIVAEQTSATQTVINTAVAVVGSTKNLRSHLTELQVIARTQAPLLLGVATSLGVEVHTHHFEPPIFILSEHLLPLEA